MSWDKNKKYNGKICEKHPDLAGLRRNGECLKCNKIKSNKYRKARLALLVKTSPLHAMKARVRRRITHILKGTSKSMTSEQMLGCDWQELKSHIEQQFRDGMDWDNIGEWEVDHIVPLSSAKTIEDVIRLSHHTNLQPLWTYENRVKGSKTAVDGLHSTK